MQGPSSLIGTGIYPLEQAARLLHVECRTLRRWILGYHWSGSAKGGSSPPLWSPQHEDDEILLGDEVIGFRDLLELRFVAAFVARGVGLSTVRATIEKARTRWGDYPLTRRKFLTDGKGIYLEAAKEEHGSDESDVLIDVRHDQLVFHSIIRPSLYEGIEWSKDGGATRWYPLGKNKSIVLDPKVQFGNPVIADVGIPTDAIRDAYFAEGKDVAATARIYDISPAQVSAAVRFEERMAA